MLRAGVVGIMFVEVVTATICYAAFRHTPLLCPEQFSEVEPLFRWDGFSKDQDIRDAARKAVSRRMDLTRASQLKKHS
jgi:hypothetical protein